MLFNPSFEGRQAKVLVFTGTENNAGQNIVREVVVLGCRSKVGTCCVSLPGRYSDEKRIQLW
jgi:hypothetical protein